MWVLSAWRELLPFNLFIDTIVSKVQEYAIMCLKYEVVAHLHQTSHLKYISHALPDTMSLRYQTVVYTKINVKVIKYFRHGRLHRVGHPCSIWCDGDVSWYEYGILHRIDGPALSPIGALEMYAVGKEPYFIRGKKLSKIQHRMLRIKNFILDLLP